MRLVPHERHFLFPTETLAGNIRFIRSRLIHLERLRYWKYYIPKAGNNQGNEPIPDIRPKYLKAFMEDFDRQQYPVDLFMIFLI